MLQGGWRGTKRNKELTIKERGETWVQMGQLCPRGPRLGCVQTVTSVLRPACTPLILSLATSCSAPLPGPSARGECALPGQWALGERLATQSTGLLPTGIVIPGAAPHLGTASCLPTPTKPSPCSSLRGSLFSLKSFCPRGHNH